MVSFPDVYVIGSSRSGTSTLRTYLAQHPQLYVPDVLEPRYHAADTREALGGPGDQEMAATMVASVDDYLDLYRARAPHQRGVEVTPAYLSSSRAAESIREVSPNALIVAILRHPVERAFSSFRLERLDGTEPKSSFQEALAEESRRSVAGWGYIWRYRERGLYGKHLSRFFQAFPRHQVLVCLYDDWRYDGGRQLLNTVFQFLRIDPLPLTSPIRVVNSTSPEKFRARGLSPPGLDVETALALRDSYATDFDVLENLIDRNLRRWREWRPPALGNPLTESMSMKCGNSRFTLPGSPIN
jgi:hypothetical protein